MFYYEVLLQFAFILSFIIGVIIYFRLANRDQSEYKAGDCRVSRIADTIILIFSSGLLFIYTANKGIDVGLLQFDQLEPNYVRAYLIVTGIALGLLIFCYVMCMFWHAGRTVIMVFIVYMIYSIMLKDNYIEAIAGQFGPIRKTSWAINYYGSDVKGVELWVNGVNMGSMPLTITPQEFKAKVPYWSEPPVGFDDKENVLKDYRYSPWKGLQRWYYKGWQWHEFVIPEDNSKIDSFGIAERRDISEKDIYSKMEDKKLRTYYAKLKYGNEWGYTDRNDIQDGNGGRYVYNVTSRLDDLRLPQREGRLEKLLDIARACDYMPSDGWYDAMETFNDDGIVAVRKLVPIEPEMGDLLKRWATWKYDLDSVSGTDAAWRKFEEICQQVDEVGEFSSSNIAGQAIEMLISRLPSDKLVEKAYGLLDSAYLYYQWISWVWSGEKYFGYSRNPDGLYVVADTGTIRGACGSDELPIHIYAVALAVWKMDEYLDAQQPDGDNIIEEKLMAAFIAKNYNNIDILRLALTIGGSSLDKYLLRQNWQADESDLSYRHSVYIFSSRVNGWLYLLARLDSEAGRKFRREHTELVFDLYDQCINDINVSNWLPQFDCMVVDAGLGTNSLAWRYFPRFCEIMRDNDGYSLSLQFEYLARMEPYSTPEMYAQCWRDFSGDVFDFSLGISGFIRRFPEEKRQAIVQALQAELDNDVSNITFAGNDTPDSVREYLMPIVRNFALEEESSSEEIEKILNSLHTGEAQPGKDKAKPEFVRPWLASFNPPHPIMDELVNDPNPEFRVLVLEAIAAHPVPANRKRLEILLADKNEQVRAAAEQTQQQIAELLATPLEKLTGLPIREEE